MTKRNATVVGSALAIVVGLFVVRTLLHTAPLDQLSSVEARTWQGSWHFPRGGPYVLGFESPGTAILFINDKPVVSGSGTRSVRIVYPPGIVAVKFHGPPNARLLWHPPGRRGALEYVPTSSLSPEPPSAATFGIGAGAYLGDAVVVTLMLLVLVVMILLLVRPRVDRRMALIVGGVFVAAFAVRLIGISAFGQTWDEDEYWCSGRNYLINILSLDFSNHSWRWNFEHPPITKFIAGYGGLWQDGYGAARAMFALFGSATCALVVVVGKRLFSLSVGLYAAVICVLLPRFIAHDRIVGHETPSVFFWTLLLLLALRVAETEDRNTMLKRVAVMGLVGGIAASTRFANLLVGPVVGMALLCFSARRHLVRNSIATVVIAPVAAALTFFVLWPRMWYSPLRHLRAAWDVLKDQNLPENYLGELVQLPDWHYFPTYFLVTTPIVVLLCAFGLGVYRAAARREKSMLVLFVWLLAPFGVAWSPVRQDGVRYVLMALVPLTLLAGAGLDQLASWFKHRRAPVVVGAAVGLYLVVCLARVYPYYLDYYGEHVGGPSTVAKHKWFEIGWWGEGISDAVDYVNKNAKENDRVFKGIQPIHVNWFRHDLWRNAGLHDADWVLVNDLGEIAYPFIYRQPLRLPDDLTLEYEVSVQGAPLIKVYHRKRKAKP